MTYLLTWRSKMLWSCHVFNDTVELSKCHSNLTPYLLFVELEPGSGWYTEILAPFLVALGYLIEATPSLSAKFAAKLKAAPALYGHTTMVPFAPPEQVQLGAAGLASPSTAPDLSPMPYKARRRSIACRGLSDRAGPENRLPRRRRLRNQRQPPGLRRPQHLPSDAGFRWARQLTCRNEGHRRIGPDDAAVRETLRSRLGNCNDIARR